MLRGFLKHSGGIVGAVERRPELLEVLNEERKNMTMIATTTNDDLERKNLIVKH